MLSHINILSTTRHNFIHLTKGYSIDQLNFMPPGFNNNLIWHLGHIVVTQQLLTYGLSQLPLLVDDTMVAKYRKGTKPEGTIYQDEVDVIKDLMLTTVEQTAKDLESGRFTNFKPYQTSYNLTLHTLEDALTFNHIHEAMHLGYVFSIRKFIN